MICVILFFLDYKERENEGHVHVVSVMCLPGTNKF